MQQGEGTTRGRRRVSPAWLFGVAALIASLAGSAVAVDKITSNDIAPNAVRSKHVKAGQIKPADTNLTKSRSATVSRTTSDAVELTDVALSAKVRRGDLVAIHGSAVVDPGSDSCVVILDLSGAGLDDELQVLHFPAPAPPLRKGFNGTSLGAAELTGQQAIESVIATPGKLRVLPVLGATGASGCQIGSRTFSLGISR